MKADETDEHRFGMNKLAEENRGLSFSFTFADPSLFIRVHPFHLWPLGSKFLKKIEIYRCLMGFQERCGAPV
jgi:hypothetical protein